MEDIALELIELGAVFFGLGLLARLAGRIGLSPVPLYLLGGLAFGTGGIIPLTGIESFTSLAGEVGVILLLLLLGLEYSAAELVTGMKRSWMAGLLDIVLNAAPGAAVALILGWGPVGALVLGGVSPQTLHAGHRLEVRTTDVLRRSNALFRTYPDPNCQTPI